MWSGSRQRPRGGSNAGNKRLEGVSVGRDGKSVDPLTDGLMVGIKDQG
jgi:hypothetical protein